MAKAESYRAFLRTDRWAELASLPSDQRQGLPAPPAQKSCPDEAARIKLVPADDLEVGATSVIEAIGHRASRRRFTDEWLTLEELSFLLWATQGVRRSSGGGGAIRRTVPSAGSRHPFETYLVVNRVEGVAPGLYRYLPLDHALCFLGPDEERVRKVDSACWGQSFVGRGAVVFFWTAIPYRTEWRYTIVSPKLIALDAGHMCQNLYLACEAIGAGTCAIGAYNQAEADAVVGVDGQDEFVIYIAPVGKVP
jgi:SagB-type dehydrogenase family enzyme